ncbi:6-phosphogluconolactonase [Parablastomonas sp. CN1-191]|uniref:6-phosphogluconolactonase n=1 Tax=Parablastomonas sp. CN1-191 TaxID=3400908 RepID=UPI003BF9061A
MTDIQRIEGADDAAIAAWLTGELVAALARRERIVISVPGGSTPFPILARLQKHALDWSRVEVWPGDDRCVPEDHPASNVGKIRAAFKPLGAAVTPLVEDATPPVFALVWLGMGEDGHVASLFPNTDPRPDAAATVVRITPDPLPPEAPFDRLSLTLSALLLSDRIALVMRGAAKRALFEAAARGENDLPVARLLAAARQPITCFD